MTTGKTCKTCKCPLMLLKAETRTQCARCCEGTTPEALRDKSLERAMSKVYRAPRGPRTADASNLKLDSFIRNSSKKNRSFNLDRNT